MSTLGLCPRVDILTLGHILECRTDRHASFVYYGKIVVHEVLSESQIYSFVFVCDQVQIYLI